MQVETLNEITFSKPSPFTKISSQICITKISVETVTMGCVCFLGLGFPRVGMTNIPPFNVVLIGKYIQA